MEDHLSKSVLEKIHMQQSICNGERGIRSKSLNRVTANELYGCGLDGFVDTTELDRCRIGENEEECADP